MNASKTDAGESPTQEQMKITDLSPGLSSPNMTIGEAIDRYQAGHRNSVSPLLRELVGKMIDENTQTEFSNDSFSDALYLTDVMFRRAQKSIQLLTGPGVEMFLQALAESFEKLLERFSKTGGTVRIVLLDSEMPQFLSALMQKYESTLQVRRARNEEPIKHFIVSDAKMARVEEVHPKITRSSLATEIKARVYFNEPEKALVFENFFNTIWEQVSKFKINQAATA